MVTHRLPFAALPGVGHLWSWPHTTHTYSHTHTHTHTHAHTPTHLTHKHNSSINNLLPHTRSHSLSAHTLSTLSLSTHTLSTHTLSTHTLSTNTLSTHTLSKNTLSTHTLSTNTLSTNTLSTNTLSTHTLSTNTLSTNTLSTQRNFPHTNLTYNHFTYTNSCRRGTMSHPPSFCVAGVGQMALGGARGPATHKLNIQSLHIHKLVQAWHNVTSTVVLRGRRGTDGTGWRAWSGFVPLCLLLLRLSAPVSWGSSWQAKRNRSVTGVALTRIHRRFAWQAWGRAAQSTWKWPTAAASPKTTWGSKFTAGRPGGRCCTCWMRVKQCLVEPLPKPPHLCVGFLFLILYPAPSPPPPPAASVTTHTQ